MGRDTVYYVGMIAGLVLGAVGARAMHYGGFTQIVLSVVAGLIVARIADRIYQEGRASRLEAARLGRNCPRCGAARVGRFCSRCGAEVGERR